MSYKTIMVYADLDKAGAARLAAACALAARFDAHLVGLHVVRMPMVPAYVAIEAPAAFAQAQSDLWRERGEQAIARFDEACAAAGVASTEHRVIQDRFGDLLGEAVRAARAADVIVAPQPDPDDGDPALQHMAEKLVMDSGRPVLIAPYAEAPRTIATRPVVMWNGSRECARATFEALPILRAAEEVFVLTVDPDTSPETGDGPLPGADIAAALARHDVRVSTRNEFGRSGDVGELMLNFVADVGADLIVMGAYGHPRLQEMLFGGATRTILRAMTAPVLAAH